MTNLLADFGNLISVNIFLGLAIALVAGIVSSFSPCVLTSIPLVVGYVGGYAGDDKKKAFFYSISFVVGMTVTFVTLGLLSALLGQMMTAFGTWWYIVLSVLMFVLGLQMLGVINVIPNRSSVVSKRKGIFGAFLIGLLGGLFCSPCSTPVLIAILVFVAEKGNIFYGILLLLFYSIGHSILIVVAGSSIAVAQKLSGSVKTKKMGILLKNIIGVLILMGALYLVYLANLGI